MSWTEWTDTLFRGLNLKDLKVDEAYFNVSNGASDPFWLYVLSEECVKCPFKRHGHIVPKDETVLKLEVARNLELRLFHRDLGKYVFPNDTSNPELRWSAQPDLGQFGVYDLRITSASMIQFATAKEPVNIYFCMKKIAVT